jgi:hypothetical protein
LGAKAPVPCRQNFQRVVVRAEGEGKKEEEEKKGGAVATVRHDLKRERKASRSMYYSRGPFLLSRAGFRYR